MTVLEIDRLCKRYGRTQVLFDVSLSVERGQIYGLLGPNGSGKTTSLACALGLTRPNSGRAFVLGEPSSRVHRTRGRVGVVFDRSVLVSSLTVRQNLEYLRRLGGYTDARPAAELLDLVELTPHAARRAGKLSLGQGKRLAIAGALLGRPDLLVLDEPLSGLDTLGVRSMLRMFRELADEGTTLVLSSHRLHEMQTVVTHAGIVLDGRVVRQGALDELLEAHRDRHELVVQPLELAAAAIEEHPGATLVETREVPRGPHPRAPLPLDARLLVDLEGTSAAELNRRLVSVGCEVSSLTPVRLTLQQVFEGLVDAHHVREVA